MIKKKKKKKNETDDLHRMDQWQDWIDSSCTNQLSACLSTSKQPFKITIRRSLDQKE